MTSKHAMCHAQREQQHNALLLARIDPGEHNSLAAPPPRGGGGGGGGGGHPPPPPNSFCLAFTPAEPECAH